MNSPDSADMEKPRFSSGEVAAAAAFFERWDSFHAPTPVKAPMTAMPTPMGSALVTDRRRTPEGAGSALGWSGWSSSGTAGSSEESGASSGSSGPSEEPGASSGSSRAAGATSGSSRASSGWADSWLDCWGTVLGSSRCSSSASSAWATGCGTVVAPCAAIQLVRAGKQWGCSVMTGCRSGRRVAIRASSPAGVSGLRSASASRSGCDEEEDGVWVTARRVAQIVCSYRYQRL